MSAKREHRKRRRLRRAYIEEIYHWLAAEPPRILFWRHRKWKKKRPVYDKRKDPFWDPAKAWKG